MIQRITGINVHPDGKRIVFSGALPGDVNKEIWVMENLTPSGSAAPVRPR
jgi:hypothetical protein